MENDNSNNNSMWLQNSLHIPSDPLASLTAGGKTSTGGGTDDTMSNSGFAAPAPLSQQGVTNNNNTNTSRRGRLPSLALCSAMGNSDFNSEGSSSQRPSSARASVAGAHSQQLFSLQEQLNVAKSGQQDLKSELNQLQERLELEQKSTQRWKSRAEQESEQRQAAEKKLSDAKYSDSGEMASLREELSSLEQQLRDERRRSTAHKAEAVKQLTEQFEQERAAQEQWWKESAAETSARIANLEQAAAQANTWKREMEVSQRNETDLRGHVESLRSELDSAQNMFEVELRQQVCALKDESTRSLLKQEDEFLARISQIQKEEGHRVAQLRGRVNELEEMRHGVEAMRRDFDAAQELCREREAELAAARRQAAAARAQQEAEHEGNLERAEAEHRQQMESLMEEHAEELAKMRQRVAAAGTLNERCARLEKLANEHLSTSQKHEAELQAVLAQLGDVQRANLRLEQEKDDMARRVAVAEQGAQQAHDEAAQRLEAMRGEREQQCRTLQQAMDQLAEEHKEVEAEWEANLESMLARISTMEAAHAQAEAGWQKERMSLRAAESDARRAAFESGDNTASMQTTINVLTQKLEESNNFAQTARRERDAAVSQLSELRSTTAENERAQSKAEVDLAAARSTVRALETRLEVVRAGSVAAGASMAAAQQANNGGNGNFWAAPPSSSSGFSALPRASGFGGMKPGQVVEIGEDGSNSNGSSSSSSNGQHETSNIVDVSASSQQQQQHKSNSQPPRRNTAAANVRSALVSRSPSSQNRNINNTVNDDDNSDSKPAKATALLLPSTSGQQQQQQQQRRARPDENEAANMTRVVDDGVDRVFAFTGFDPSEVQRLSREVELLGGRVVECKANSVPPSDCTHLVSNGLMTVKLLASLARGMWVVPSSFLHQCVASRGFVDERSNGGIRHEGGAPFFASSAVAFSPAFHASRHAQTAATVVAEGGATVVDTSDCADIHHLLESAGAWPKLGRNLKQRTLVCTGQELNEVQDELAGKRFHLDVVTWDAVIKRLYPESLSA